MTRIQKMVNYIQYLAENQFMYILGESQEIITDDKGSSRCQKIIYACFMGSESDKLCSTKEKRKSIINIIVDLIKFYCLEQEVPSSSGYDNEIHFKKLRVIYLHSEVGTFQRGSLNIIGEAC